MFLLDTNVISELRKPKPHGAVVAWLEMQQSNALFISAMTVAEIQQGIELTRVQEAERAEVLESWLVHELLPSAQVLPMDADVARTWAKLMHKRSNTLFEDALIAATALTHRLTVVTRNVRDFKALGVDCVDPFANKKRQ
jgi:predicted nucleic acid-binding protein